MVVREEGGLTKKQDIAILVGHNDFQVDKMQVGKVKPQLTLQVGCHDILQLGFLFSRQGRIQRRDKVRQGDSLRGCHRTGNCAWCAGKAGTDAGGFRGPCARDVGRSIGLSRTGCCRGRGSACSRPCAWSN